MSPEIHIVTANHLEVLADAIATLVASSPPEQQDAPLQPETVLVQSKGMQQWVSMAIAERNGICANIDFPFPNAFLSQLYEVSVGKVPKLHLFDPKVLTFRIMALLPQLMHREEFECIQHYLVDPMATRKQFQLASKIADILDQYQIYRPEMILNWESGRQPTERPANAWQAILWNALSHDVGTAHRAAIQQQLIRTLTLKKTSLTLLPKRIAVFGISHLPPFHLQVLKALSYQIPIYLFLLNPCRHYWGDILSDQQLLRSKQHLNIQDFDPVEDLHIDRGHRLLASWGKQGRAFFNLIQQMDGQSLDLFTDNTPQSLLAYVQQDILDLKDQTDQDGVDQNRGADQSIQVHACHSPMRETEVLYDQLINLLENDPALTPRDILVMTPDISTYAPYIHAVFGNPQSGEPKIAYTLADQGMPQESRLIEGFLRLLDLHLSRFQASHIMALLAYPYIRRHFGLHEADLPKIEMWLDNANIRWGWNGAHRKSYLLPRIEQNTWRHGLDRLILGYAMAGDGQMLFDGILPQEGVDSSDGQTLGALSDFVETLYRHMGVLPEAATITHWHGFLTSVLDKFFWIDDAAAHEMKALRDVVDELEMHASAADFSKKVPFDVVHDYLKTTLNRASFGTGFLAGRITFCAMLPMRSIPAKVICILGLGYDAFPQDIREPAFNLIAAEPAAGDRSKRDDDKYLFLEALISARQVLYLSYVGRSVQDNSPIPPSVVIDELLEYLEAGYGVKATHVQTVHPLQAFSRRYFNNSDPSLYSYSKENLEASQAIDNMQAAPPFFSMAIKAPESSWRRCTLDQIFAFYTHPARFLLEQRLGIYLRQDMVMLEDKENFNLDPLERFKIKQMLLKYHMDGQTDAGSYKAIRSAGLLPHGTLGRVILHQLDNEVNQFVERLHQCLPDETKTSRTVTLTVGPYILSGELDGIYQEKHVAYRLAKVRPQDLLSLFIAHLVLAGDDQPRPVSTSRLVCQDALWEMGPISNPYDILRDLLDYFWKGLQFPLPLFPKTSFEYASKHHQGKPSRQAMAAAIGKWRGNPPYALGESMDPYLNLCFGDQNPLNDVFEKTALNVFLPLLSAASKR